MKTKNATPRDGDIGNFGDTMPHHWRLSVVVVVAVAMAVVIGGGGGLGGEGAHAKGDLVKSEITVGGDLQPQ
jgi:hypothetical protein